MLPDTNNNVPTRTASRNIFRRHPRKSVLLSVVILALTACQELPFFVRAERGVISGSIRWIVGSPPLPDSSGIRGEEVPSHRSPSTAAAMVDHVGK